MDYFYGSEAELFTFYRIPKLLITDKRFKHLDCEAKLLYGLLLDRMCLSAKNEWLDRQGRVYIIFRISSIMEALGCAHGKAERLLADLERFGLLERKRQGRGLPYCLYPKRFC
ncbi:replication initiator protein A [Dysosmobacter sp.]